MIVGGIRAGLVIARRWCFGFGFDFDLLQMLMLDVLLIVTAVVGW